MIDPHQTSAGGDQTRSVDRTPWWRSKPLVLLARIALSVGLMFLIFRVGPEFDTDELKWDRWTPYWLAGGLFLTICSMALGALRWKRVLFALGDEERWRRLYSHYMAGQFLSNVLPSTVGGDVIRIRRLSRDLGGDSPVAFTSVVFERLSGWLVLPIITFLGFAVNPGLWGLGRATTAPLLIAIVTLVALLLVLLAAGNEWVGRWLEGRSGSLSAFAEAVHVGIDSMRNSRDAVKDVILTAFAYQIVLLLATACAAQAIGIDPVGLTALMAFIPAVLIVQVLPLGLGGLGLREGALALFLSGIDVPHEQAVALGLLIYGMTFVASLIGLPLLAFGGRDRGQDRDGRKRRFRRRRAAAAESASA